MLDFTNLQKNAKQLPENLIRAQSSSLGCVRFFPSVFKSDAAETVSAMRLAKCADALDKARDTALNGYLKEYDPDNAASPEALLEFKVKTLIGMYLLVWSQHLSWVSSYLNSALITQFQRDLLIPNPADMQKELVESSLYCLSRYCAFIYEHKEADSTYKAFYDSLDPAIQTEIALLKNKGFVSWRFDYSTYWGSFCNESHSKMS
jgi:hypothetical protein